MDELETLAKLRHKNVMRLVGFCSKGNKLFVCNELLSNGSLDTHLHGTSVSSPIFVLIFVTLEQQKINIVHVYRGN